MLAEKLKKGYSETADPAAPQHAASSPRSKAVAPTHVSAALPAAAAAASRLSGSKRIVRGAEQEPPLVEAKTKARGTTGLAAAGNVDEDDFGHRERIIFPPAMQ